MPQTREAHPYAHPLMVRNHGGHDVCIMTRAFVCEEKQAEEEMAEGEARRCRCGSVRCRRRRNRSKYSCRSGRNLNMLMLVKG